MALLLVGCGGQPADHDHDHGAHDPAAAEAEVAAVSGNRIAIPPVVRRNLGITFAEASWRPVAATVAVPGHFELQPSAQHHYPVPVAGRVTVLVEPLEEVVAGQVLLRIEAPAWRSLQRELLDLRATRAHSDAALARARAARDAARGLSAASSDDELGVYQAEIAAAEAEVAAAGERFEQVLAEASALTGLPIAELQAVKEDQPLWRRLEAMPVRAVDAGIVREVDAATGTWVGEGTEVVHVVHPSALRFRGRALQADLIDHIRDGQMARIVPPEGQGTARRAAGITGRVRLGVTGDPTTRTVDLFVDCDPADLQPWMRPQVAAEAEVVVAGDPAMDELAIPTRAVIRDGLETVFFRRDPDDPDAVIRTVADLGPSDGRWVTVYSGIGEGDEVVIDGVYQLKLATTGQDVTAGHFHADGTWHDGEH